MKTQLLVPLRLVLAQRVEVPPKLSKRIKSFVLRLSLPIVTMLFLQGCISAHIIEKSGNTGEAIYNLREYNEAFIADDQLIINGKASRKGGKREEYSVVFQLDPESGLPGYFPVSVELKKHPKPVPYVPVDLHYVSIPVKNPIDRRKPESYANVAITTTKPSIYINTFAEPCTFEDFEFNGGLILNNFHALYVPEGKGSERRCASIHIQPYRKRLSNRALLAALPPAVFADTVIVMGCLYGGGNPFDIEYAFID